MNRYFSSAACAAALLLSSASVDAILAPVAAQQMDVSFDSFHDYLANYGDWLYSDRWGEVWVPENVPDDFQPYATNGYWAQSDQYGWIWVSNYEWGDVPFHYGRWVNDPDIGWMWIPGYVWSPAWVVWRHNGNYVGWMPMPPDREFLGQAPSGPSIGFGISLGGGLRLGLDFNDTNGEYGYSQWYPDYDQRRFAQNWVFVPTRHFGDRDSHRYWTPRDRNADILRNTTDATHYAVVNNYVVNRGIDPRVIEKAGGHPVMHVHINEVIKHPGFVAPANRGVEIQTRMRQEMPRGTGRAGSAPTPPPKVVQGLSSKVPQHQGHAPTHVFTKETVTNAPHGNASPANGPGAAPGGPGGGPMMHEHKPGETGNTGETRGGAMTGPAGTMQNKPGETQGTSTTGGESSGGMMRHRHETTVGAPPANGPSPTGTMNAPAATGGPQNAPAETGGEMMRHRHETTPPPSGPNAPGGAMNGPGGGMMMHHHENATTQGAPTNTPVNTPSNVPANAPMMTHRHDNAVSPTGGAAPGPGGPAHMMERQPPATAPTEHAVSPHTPPQPPPQKNENKKDKDKPDHG